MALSSFRQTFDHRETGLPELRLLGRARQRTARVPGLGTHSHSGLYEIFCIERGEPEWWVEKEVHQLSAGDLYLNRPGEVHGSLGPGMRPCAYIWIQLSFGKNGLPGLGRKVSQVLREALSDPRVRRFTGSRLLQEDFLRLWRLHGEPHPYRALLMRAQLHLLIGRLAGELATHAQGDIPGKSYSLPVQRVRQFLEAGENAVYSIADLSRVAGLGRTQLNDRFLAETGYTPANYARRRRLDQARHWLKTTDWSITRIGLELGFSSSQHFATAFKQVEGMTPGQYRANIRSGL